LSKEDEQNIFKAEQEYEAALQDYEHYNNLLKTEIPRFLQLTTSFISPLFHSFFYMQYVTISHARFYIAKMVIDGEAVTNFPHLLHVSNRLNILYTTYGKLQQFSEGRFDLNQTDIESIYLERLGDTHSRIEELTITKRPASTGKYLSPPYLQEMS
jgi:amphiphysin